MALKAGRVGVAPSQVDKNGNITGGGSSVTVVDNLNSSSSTDALSAKQGKNLNEKFGGLQFRINDGVAQYKVGDDWVNFNNSELTVIDLVSTIESSLKFINTSGAIAEEPAGSDTDNIGYIDLTDYIGHTICLYYAGSMVNRYKATFVASYETGQTGDSTFWDRAKNYTVASDGKYSVVGVVPSAKPVLVYQPTGLSVSLDGLVCYVVILD